MEPLPEVACAPGGVLVGRYELATELGHGGMSTVFMARDRLTDRDVALKVLRGRDGETASHLVLQQEFRAMTRLRHPGLVEVYDYGTLPSGAPFFTMELLEGKDLSTLLPLEVDDALRVMTALADVLAFMHARGYVHRDVKPANVRVLPRRAGAALRVKLMDCGLAERSGGGGGLLAGTVPYLAPEAHLGAPADARGDLYALGVLAFEITAGRLPFENALRADLLKAKLQTAPDLGEIRADLPLPLVRVVRDLLAAEPAARPATAAEVLARLGHGSDVEVTSASTAYVRTPAFVGRIRELAALRAAITGDASRERATMVLGPSGAGKTRLMQEALLEARLHGCLVCQAVARGFGVGAFDTLQQLVASMLHVQGAEAALEAAGGREVLGPARPGFQGSPGADEDPVATRQTWMRALSIFVEHLSARQRVVLAVDDIHLADVGSVNALAELATEPELASVSLIGTIRMGKPVAEPLQQFLSQSRVLTLEQMSEPHIAELIVRTLGVDSPNPVFVRELQQSSEGNAYFVIEILRQLAERGHILRKHNGLQLPMTLDVSGLPASLYDALARRVSGLTPQAVTLGRVVAVLGHSVDFRLGRLLAGLDKESFFDAIDELRRGEILEVSRGRLRTHHPRLGEVLYEGMEEATRKALHLRTACELEALFGDASRDHAAELGRHFEAGGERRKALTYLVMAGDARYEAFAYHDAGEAYRRAERLLGAAPALQRLALERKLCDRLGRIGFYYDHHAAVRHLERAERLHLRHGLLRLAPALSKGLPPWLTVALVLLLSTLWNLLLLRRHPLRTALNHLLDAFTAASYFTNCLSYTGRMREALEAAERLSPFVYSKRRLPNVAYLMAKSTPLLFTHRFAQSAMACELSLEILETDRKTPISAQDRVHSTGGALITRVMNDLMRGNAAGSAWWVRLEEYVQAHPTSLLQAWLMEARVLAAHRRGDLARTQEEWAGFVESARAAEVHFVQTKCRVWLGMAYLQHGRMHQAKEVADDIIRESKAKDNPMLLAFGLLVRGQVLFAWGLAEEAHDDLERAFGLSTRQDVGCNEVRDQVKLAQAEACADGGDTELAEHLALEVREASMGDPLEHHLNRLRATRLLGRAALQRGQLAEGTALVKEALEIAERLGDAFETALCEHELGAAARAAGDTVTADALVESSKARLLSLCNDYQLRRLGYGDVRMSLTGASEVSAVATRHTGDTLRSAAGSSSAESMVKVRVLEGPPAREQRERTAREARGVAKTAGGTWLPGRPPDERGRE